MDADEWLERWDEVVATGESAAIEEAWLGRLEAGLGDGVAMAEALRRLRSASKKTLAATLLEVATEDALENGAWSAARVFLLEELRLGIGSAEEVRVGLERCVRHLWADRPSLESLLSSFPLQAARKPAETLASLEAWLAFDLGGVFAMQGRGAGRVVEINPQLGVLRLDFVREKKVPMPIDAAAKYLTPLPEGHFLRRRLDDEATLAREVADDPAAALQTILESFGTAMTVSEIKAALDGLVVETQWTSWWNRARKHPGLLASGSGTRVQYRLAAEGGAVAELREEFSGADLSARLELARRHGARSRDLASYMADELLAAASDEPAAGLAWEALQIAARLGADPTAVEAVEDDLIGRAGPVALLERLADVAQREQVLALVRRDMPEKLVATAAAWLEREAQPRVLAALARDLVVAGEEKALQSFLDQVFLHPQKSPAAFAWACEETDERLAPVLDERRGGALLVRLVELAERGEFAPFRARFKVVLSAAGLAGRIIQDRLTAEQARRLLQILERQGEMGEERAWLRRALAARFPELREERRDVAVPALQTTVRRLQNELKELLERQIPETLKAIQVARAEGDLRENFEYHAQRAKQELLSSRASQIQADLARIKVIDPTRVDVSRVRAGTRVTLDADGASRELTILGPYEADPDNGVVSHASEAGEALLERAVGDRVTLAGVTYTIAAIVPAT